jgi:hypothetical protein
MLHHRHVAILRGLFDVDLALLDVRKLDLLVLLGLGVHRRPSEGEVKRRLTRGLVAITHQLQVKLR